MNDAKAPFNNLAFRKAVAEDMNTKFIAQRAYFGALAPATGGAESAVTGPQVAQWFSPSLKNLEYNYSVKKAKATLKAAGFKWSKSGVLLSTTGKALPKMTVLIGGPGWTDYISAADNISNELKSIGVDTTVVQEPYSTYANDLDKGLYTFAESWGNGNNSTPYYQYYYMFNPSESAPIGKVRRPTGSATPLRSLPRRSPRTRVPAVLRCKRPQWRRSKRPCSPRFHWYHSRAVGIGLTTRPAHLAGFRLRPIRTTTAARRTRKAQCWSTSM